MTSLGMEGVGRIVSVDTVEASLSTVDTLLDGGFEAFRQSRQASACADALQSAVGLLEEQTSIPWQEAAVRRAMDLTRVLYREVATVARARLDFWSSRYGTAPPATQGESLLQERDLIIDEVCQFLDAYHLSELVLVVRPLAMACLLEIADAVSMGEVYHPDGLPSDEYDTAAWLLKRGA